MNITIRKPASSRFSDISGKRFDRLLVLRYVGISEDHNSCWECACDCGNTVTVKRHYLMRKLKRSCGCVVKEQIESITTHGHATGGKLTSEYATWMTMKARCGNPKSKSYPSYGGRGIKVCERWKDSFENFFSDMGAKPSRSHSIHRVDNDGDYTPDNCVWATGVEQGLNKRNNVLITAFGESLPVSEWSRRTGIGYQTLHGRLRRGWSHEKIVTTK